MHKITLLLLKNCKNHPALRDPLPDLLASGSSPRQPPSIERSWLQYGIVSIPNLNLNFIILVFIDRYFKTTC